MQHWACQTCLKHPWVLWQLFSIRCCMESQYIVFMYPQNSQLHLNQVGVGTIQWVLQWTGCAGMWGQTIMHKPRIFSHHSWNIIQQHMQIISQCQWQLVAFVAKSEFQSETRPKMSAEHVSYLHQMTIWIFSDYKWSLRSQIIPSLVKPALSTNRTKCYPHTGRMPLIMETDGLWFWLCCTLFRFTSHSYTQLTIRSCVHFCCSCYPWHFLNAGLQQQAAVLPAHSSDIPVFTAVGHVIIYPNMQAAIKVYW